MRRFADVVIACVLLAISAPLMIGVALSIKSESPGPIFVRHARIGRSGRRFQMLKFRSLIEDPGCTKPVWVRKTTEIGQFLRYTRIEDLPQLINVLRGDMSMFDQDGSSPSFLD